jgi:hypothetical protein
MVQTGTRPGILSTTCLSLDMSFHNHIARYRRRTWIMSEGAYGTDRCDGVVTAVTEAIESQGSTVTPSLGHARTLIRTPSTHNSGGKEP